MAYTPPTADFVTSSLSGDITDVATSMTIGTGLDLPAANGILQIDYDSTGAVGDASGPETITYTAYVSGTGAVTGMVRGAAGTTGVTHSTGASVQCGMSSAYLQQSPQFDTWNSAGTLTYASTDSPTFTATVTGDSTTSIYPGVRIKAEQDQALSHYWKFESSAADVGTATMADIGTPTYTAGKFDNALTLNGTDQALSITDAAGFKPTGDFTIGAWFKTSNTGANKAIFQSYSDNTNANGVSTSVSSGNVLNVAVGNNAASASTVITGTTTVTDGNWHYVVWSYRNNYSQVYLDGNLEMSGYTVTPTYAATNYVRIGCANDTGANGSWFNGQIDDLFLINGYALDEKTIKAKYDAAAAQGTSDITLTKYFLCTASSYSAPNTTITMYGGTDYALANADVDNVYYSSQKAPYGFPLNAEKWTVSIAGNVMYEKTSPTQNTWYGGANALGATYPTITIPIGSWRLGYELTTYGYKTSATAFAMEVALSTSDTTPPDRELVCQEAAEGASGTMSTTRSVKREKYVTFPAKKTLYLLARTTTATANTMGIYGSATPAVVRATSTLL